MPITTETEGRRKRAPRPTNSIVSYFQNWLGVRDQGAQLKTRQDDLRLRLLDILDESGVEDEKGNKWIDLQDPVEFTDKDGKTFVYRTLKRERHLKPAQPTPDPLKAKKLLEKKGLWLTADQQKALQRVQALCPFVVISVDVDVDAVAKALFTDRITEKEYQATLIEQKPEFQFRPSE